MWLVCDTTHRQILDSTVLYIEKNATTKLPYMANLKQLKLIIVYVRMHGKVASLSLAHTCRSAKTKNTGWVKSDAALAMQARIESESIFAFSCCVRHTTSYVCVMYVRICHLRIHDPSIQLCEFDSKYTTQSHPLDRGLREYNHNT